MKKGRNSVCSSAYEWFQIQVQRSVLFSTGKASPGVLSSVSGISLQGRHRQIRKSPVEGNNDGAAFKNGPTRTEWVELPGRETEFFPEGTL